MNMFTRKAKPTTSQVDEINRKKTATKILDVKKDLKDRLRYLKSFIETTSDVIELKQFFDLHYSQIYYIFYESFVNVESSIKQKLSKPIQQDLNDVLFIFLKILLLQPEKLHQRWQVRSIGRIIQKLIHVGNTKTIKFYGTRLFLIWYQILNKNKTHVEELMFQKLIQGFDTFHSYAQLGTTSIDLLSAEAQKVFNTDTQSTAALHINKSISPFEINPIIPFQTHEHSSGLQQPSLSQQATAQNQLGQQTSQQSSSGVSGVFNLTAEMLEKVLECMQQDCTIIEWSSDKNQQSQRCYEFLFDEFKRFYLSYMFPNAFLLNSARNYSLSTSISSNFANQHSLSLNVYAKIDLINLLNEQPMPTFERPILASIGNMTSNDERKLTQLHCKEEIIKWLIGVLLMDSSLTSPKSFGTSTTSSISTSGIGSSMQSDNFSSGSSSTIGTLISTFDINASNRSADSDTLKASKQDDMFSSMSDMDSTSCDQISVSMSSMSINTSTASISTLTASTVHQLNSNKQLLQRVILSTVTNVNLVHEILRNTYFLNFENYATVQQVLTAYKKWFLKETKMPSFMLEPTSMQHAYPTTPIAGSNTGMDLESPMSSSLIHSDTESEKNEFMDTFQRNGSVSTLNNSLMSKDSNEMTRIGYMRCLQIFFFHSSNLLLNRNNFQRDKIKNICCYTLEIYKLFIRKIKMDSHTWTLLVTILLKVSEFLFNSEYLANNRHEPATSQLIKLMTETVLLAFVKASFSFTVNKELWDQLLGLLSSVSSNSDIIDKWIEVIDDLIRQVFKTSYQVDIYHMPTIDNKLDKKGKLKKKMLQPQITAPNFSLSGHSQHPQLASSSSSQAINGQQGKPRAKTEIYSPSSFHGIHTSVAHNHTTSANLTPAMSPSPTPKTSKLNNQESLNASQPVSIVSGMSLNQNSSSGSVSPNVSNKSSNSEKTVSTSVPPLLSRQRTMTSGDIDSTKSPSLSEEHFLAINGSNQNVSKLSNKKIDQLDPANNKVQANNSSSKTTGYDLSNSSQNSSNIDDTDASDLNDDTGDKSGTLKATQQLDSITVNTQPKINRFNSDKSIYYSSEVLAEASNSNNASMSLNENDSSNSSSSQLNNVSITFSPTSSLPPVLPPLPNSLSFTSNPLTSKVSPPSQCPPPLPPLPPALASKYALKTALYLECVEPINTATSNNTTPNNNSNSNNQANPQSDSMNKPNNDTSSLDSDNGACELSSTSDKGKDQLDTVDYRSERHIKCTSTCSDSDVFMKDSQLDTPSETASMSGNDFSGEIYTSPTTNTEYSNSNRINSDMIQVSNILQASSSSSLLMPSVPNVETTNSLNSTVNMSQIMENSNSNSPDASALTSGLLSIDSNSKNDERSASFIDNRFNGKERQLSRSSTLTPDTGNGTLTKQSSVSGYANEPHHINEAKTNSEILFKETANCLIRRLFGCLGNINAIKDPFIHKRVFEFIYNKWDKLNKIKDTLKINDLSQIIPPVTYFAPWLFEAIYQLSTNYQSGKLIAYKILCKIVIRSAANGGMWHLANDFDVINDEFMNLFYMTIHQGLNSDDKNVINCIIQNCGPKFWHCMLPSCTLLLKDFIDTCGSIDKEGPKYEAASVLGCLIGFPDYFGDMQVLSKSVSQPLGSLQSSFDGENTLHVELCTKEEMKNLIIHNLTNFTDEISNTNSRCVILCSLTCFIYDEILNQRWHPRLNDAIKRIFKDLDFREQFNPVLVKMSCDNLRFLSILAISIFQYEIQYAINIINMLNQCLVKLINSKPAIISEDYEKAIISNMFALLEWCMSMPLEKLKDNDRGTLLRNNFKLIIHICNTFKPAESSESEHVHLAAKFIIQHLLTQLNHFPFGSTGPSKIVSSVNETSDSGLNFDELTPTLFEQPNIQFFTVNNQFLISFIELPMSGNEKFFNISPDLKTSTTICRFVVRDFCGKNCWDCCILQSPDESLADSYILDIPFKNIKIATPDSDDDSGHGNLNGENEKIHSDNEHSSLADSNNNFDYTKLPFLSFEDIPKEIDILDNILKFVSFSSPECRLEPSRPLNIVWDVNTHLNKLLNVDEVKQKLLNQSQLEKQHTDTQHEAEMLQLKLKQKKLQSDSSTEQADYIETGNDPKVHSYFHLCKSFVHQMGLLSWEKRQSFNLLRKTPQLLRELKSLDDQTCRETHKIALIYIAEGQDDKMSILSNEGGSPDYEYFLSKLAWTVDLETHEGFMGGLQHNYQLKTAPYYANSCCEVLFHVSTQMNQQNDPNKISKWRHLGNDNVQIIWSEHIRDYDRSILATEFADVIICIYPLRNELYRIKITKKQSVGYFGPLFDGAIVTKQALPTLIRTTAINASRILLSNTKGYQDFFVHRAHAINNIIKTLTDNKTFEQFIGDIYSPAIIPTSGSVQISTAMGLPVSTLNLPGLGPSSSQSSNSSTVGSSSKKDSVDASYNF